MPRRFAFRLEPVLSVRQRREELKKRALASAQRAVVEQKQRIENLYAEQEEGKLRMRKLHSGELNLNHVRQQLTYLFSLERQFQSALQELRRRQEDEALKRAEWALAARERKAMERLKERRFQEYQYEVNREEQKFLDEVGQNLFRRQGQAER